MRRGHLARGVPPPAREVGIDTVRIEMTVVFDHDVAEGAPVAMFLVGGGIAPIPLGIIAGAAATRIGAPPSWWRGHLPVRAAVPGDPAQEDEGRTTRVGRRASL